MRQSDPGPTLRRADGLYAPLGRLVVDEDEDVLQCHLCGRWWTALNVHVRNAHDLSADEYREFVGLNPRQPLTARWLSDRRAAQLRERIATDERVQKGMRTGLGLARSGQLQRRAQELARERGVRQARSEQLRQSGRAVGQGRAAAFRAQRDRRARQLGFDSLRDYLWQRYEQDGARIEDLQRELNASYSAVRSDLSEAGVEVRRRARKPQREAARPSS